MTSNPSSSAYPAEYYYPEFIDNRPDDPRKSPSTNLPLKTSIDNGIGSSTTIQTKTTSTIKKPSNRKQPSKSIVLDIVMDQGLPDTDITRSVRTDPKKNLLRDPVEKNIPRLIVDDSVIKRAVRTPKIVTTDLDNDDDLEQPINSNQIINSNQTLNSKQTINSYQINNAKKPLVNGHVNTDLKTKTKSRDSTRQQIIKYAEEEQPPVDEYWKKEVHIDDEGVVTIDPLKYDKNTYEGPFGLTRKGSFIFYIGMGVFTLLAAVFLIMTGVFYGRSYPDSSTNTAKLAGAGICALAFYLGLQLILIGLWHQKYRQENPTKTIKKPSKHNESSAHLKTSMEENEPYDYSYQQPIDYSYQQPFDYTNQQPIDYTNQQPTNYTNQQPIDYTHQQPMDYAPYGSYSNPPYVSNPNEQMLLQQPGAATGAGFYEPVVWPSNVQVETQPDPKFFQSMEWSYGAQPTVATPSTVIAFTSPTNATNNKNKNTKPEKKSHRRHHHHHHNKKTVEADPPKSTFDSIVPNSTVVEAPLPLLSKAPETNELIKSIAEMEKNTSQTTTGKNSNRIKPLDNGTEISSLNNHHHHHRRHSPRRHSPRRHHHHHRHNRHHSYSPCSTCSDRSYRSPHDFHSDIGYNHNHHNHHHHHQRSEPVQKIIIPRTPRARTPSPPKRNRSVYRDTGTGTGLETKIMRDSGVTADLEDVPNVRDNRLEQIPVVRRTIIVEPYPAEPSSQIVVKPLLNMTGKIRLGKNEKLSGDDETIIYPSTAFMNKKSKKKKQIIETKNSIEDLTLDDGNDNENENTKLKPKNTDKTSSKKNVKNAFYD